jgi:hypothetical protein
LRSLCRISISIPSLWKADCIGNFSEEKVIKKTILRGLGSGAFSHSLDPQETSSLSVGERKSLTVRCCGCISICLPFP